MQSFNTAENVNILDLEVPPELDETIATGISFIDDAFQGGLTPSSVTLFTGGPGLGKTTLMIQMANSIMQHGNVVLYNTTEENPLQVRKVVRRLGITEGFYINNNRKISDVLIQSEKLREANPGKRVLLILDSIQTHDDEFYKSTGLINSNTPVRITKIVTAYCKQTYTMAFLVGQVAKNGTFLGKNQIKHEVDAHLHLYFDKKAGPTGERILFVEKNRWGCSQVGYVLGLDPQKGLFEKDAWEK
jgi:DNA repair protein RadA/Sms